jgi:cation diffusion facilitator CzcD-associated flavoprotein CzcO
VPKWPDPPYPGSDDFEGDQLHALEYGHATEYMGTGVLVVGMGNSAMDIATDLSHHADRTLLSVRHGSWIIPKRMLGKPADQVIKPWTAVHVPWRIRQPVAQTLLRLTVGPPEHLGLPAPEEGLFQSHPTISDTITSRIAHGTIAPKPGIDRLDGDGVVFADGTREQVDAIVWCTGYRVEIPFLDRALIGDDPQELPLYKRILHLEDRDLFFIGLMQSTGSAFPILERQSRLLAAHLNGEWAPPNDVFMKTDCELRRRKALRRWGPRGRPTMRVDFDKYMHELAKEIARGRRRAATA